MSVTQQALAVGRGLAAPRTWRKAWFGGLHGADYVWAIAFALPYAAIFLAFVVYPIAFGLWMGITNKALFACFVAAHFLALLGTLAGVRSGTLTGRGPMTASEPRRN